ncbi:helicase SNF2 [Lachnospiraceae bacterium]|nr:helicase SNF2 [Lachnospiraceae bacterium]
MEQITMIDRQAESEKPSAFAMPKEEQPPAEPPAPAFSIPDAEIERILRHGSPYDGGKLRIAALYSQENTPDERVEYLKGEYGTNSGQSWQFSDGSRGGVQTRPQGLVIRDASHNAEVRLRWSEVEKRLGALIQNGQYLSGPDKQRYAALEKNYAEFGAVPLPAPGHGFPPTPADIYERYYPVIRDALLRDMAYRNACDNNDKETAYVEGGKAIEQAALTIQDTGFMRLYYDVPEYHDRLHKSLLDETYKAMTAAPELPDPPDRTSEMLAQAARMADGSNYAAPERFFLIETEGGYAVWDDIREEIYVDPEGVSEEFTSEWQAEDYLLQVKEDVARREAADWLKTEEAKLPPLKYGIGDPFTIYSEDGTKEIVLTSITDGDVFYVYPDEPGRDQVFMDREMFEHSLRTGHIRDAQPKEAVQTAASYRSGDEAIVIQQYPNGQFYNHYGYDEQRRFAIATAGGFATFEEAETALRSHRPKAERVMEELVPGTEAGQTPEGMAHEGAGEDITPAAPGTDAKSTAAPQEPTYQVGDTVYLEDTAYIVEEIGLFDVQLRDPTLAYPVLRAESKERLERMLWADVRNNAFLPGAKIEVTTPNYRVRVTVEEAPVLEEQMGEAGISTARFVHENGDVTFSFAEADRDAVEHILSAQREEDPFADVEKWAADYQRQTQTAIAALEPGQRRIVDAMQTAGFFYDPLSNTALDPLIFRAGDLTGGYPTFFKTWDEAYAFIDGAELKDTPGLREQVQSVLHPDPTWAQNAHKLDVRPASDQVGPKPEVTATAETIYPGDKNGLPFDVVVERLHFGEPEHGQPEQTQQPAARNFRITDDHLGEGGPKAKFRANMDAINLLHELEFDGRDATPEEQEVLSRYVGWGGLADAFDEKKDSWAGEFRELYAALSPEEYAAARASTLNAHYTSPTVIRAIYDAVEQMGFQTGNILEPSMGVGNFFGLLPESMQGSRLYGVELDSITGRIAQKLYPEADIKVAGFQTTDRRDFFDLCVGNVPFGDYKVNDKPYNRLGFSIHNYFFAKAIDQVRPGGVVALVTSRYTMDAKSPDARKYIAQRAELLGAVRLPNNAFKANAGTEVVSDILFLQKRDRPIDIEPDWVHLGQTPEGLTLNSYFVDHPEMVLGELTTESTQYGREECTVAPTPGADLAEQLREAVSHIHGSYQAVERDEADIADEAAERGAIPADPDVKNFSYALVDGEVYFRENSVMKPVELSDTAKGRVAGMIGLRQLVNDLIQYQLEDYPDGDIQAKQAELNAAYDAFYAKFGTINSSANARVFDEDSSYYLLCSLENIDEDGRLESKADMFTKRTIRPERHITSVDTPSEALAVSIGERGRVDLRFMSELLGTPGEYGRITEELRGVIFRDPREAVADDPLRGWHTADDYLSGNVRDKLMVARMAAATDPAYAVNVAALEQAQPKDLDASEIDVRLGATWIDKDYIQQFMEETFDTPWRLRSAVQVKYSPSTAEWQVTGKNATGRHDVMAYMTYGTDRASAYRILEDTLNLRDIRIYDTIEDADGKQKRVLNKKETTLAQQKQQAIKDAFRDWVWRDPRRREDLVRTYNELFNSTRPREYDGSHIVLGGMNPDITLREHQRGAIAHVLYGGNTLLAHEVGAGKTFEMAASAMEAKRLGLCQKSLFVVPNHLTLQWASEFLRLYPSAKILVATKKDFETANRKKFCARIATGDYDAVIIGHSQFEKIPISAERQERILQEQIDEITDAISEMKAMRGESFTIKQLEKTRKSLEARMEKLQATERKDDVITFEQLGVDRLFVDEAHAFKNLFLYTKMRNVAGLSTSEAQKSSDMFMKCQYMDELTGGKGTVFATGTPVSNSMTELYTMMRYLQHGTLRQKGLTHFDQWASTFGETTTAIELAPEGTGYRARTRFAKFFNLPELMSMFKEVADIKTADQLHLPVPEAKFETVVVQPSEIQKEMVADLSERAAAVHSGNIDPSVDNMLKITSDGRKIGLDQRLMNPLLPDDPSSKLNACVQNVLHIWEEGQADKLTQLLFCDLSTPKGDGTFNVYEDIRDKLVAAGVPREEIAFIHDADTEAKKKELFGKVRTGEVRVLLGSTQKMGAGTNVQDRLVAVHHLDVGWRPADMTQRNGRIIRQGNRNKQVQIFQYVTEGTFDAYLYQTLENKQKFISQIMTSKSPVRSCDDVDEQALSYAEIKALCAGNPLIREKMDLDVDVAKLKVLRADYQSKHFRLEDQLLKYFPAEIEAQQSRNKGFEADIQTVEAHPLPEEGFVGIELAGKHYAEKADAGEALLALCKEIKSTEGIPIGSYRGFQMELSYNTFEKQFQITMKGEMSHHVSLGTDARGNLTRLDNALAGIPGRLERGREQLENLRNQQAAAQVELTKPFPQEAELAEKSARLAELDAALSMEDSIDRDGGEVSEEVGDGERPSVLEDLKKRAAEIPPDKKPGKEPERG